MINMLADAVQNMVTVEIREVPAYLGQRGIGWYLAAVPALRLATRGDTRDDAVGAARSYLSCLGVEDIAIVDMPPAKQEDYCKPIF